MPGPDRVRTVFGAGRCAVRQTDARPGLRDHAGPVPGKGSETKDQHMVFDLLTKGIKDQQLIFDQLMKEIKDKHPMTI